jgi:hypothetical protein
MSAFGKDWKPSRSDQVDAQFAARLDELRSTLRVQDPGLIAERSGVPYLTVGPDRGELHIPFWENVCILSFPELINEQLPNFQQALLLYYLLTADGAPLTGKWVSFADLPDGRMYNAAFQGYSGDEIVKTFEHVGRDVIPPKRIATSYSQSNPLHEFNQACFASGGKPVELGSASFVFQALPRVPLMLTYWLGDEEFPSSCKILFDESACHYLPIDACAILGSMLVRKLSHSPYAP